MKICIINNLIRPFGSGTERVVEMIVNGLVNRGEDVFVITTKPYKQDLPEVKNVKIFGLSGFSATYYKLNSIPKFLRIFWHLINIFNFSNYLKIKNIIKQEKPDLVITNNLMGVGFLTPLAIKKNKIKHCHILHDIQLLHPTGLIIYGKEKIVDSIFAKTYQAINRFLFLKPDLVISPSAWLMKEYLDKGFFIKSHGVVLPNPIIQSNPIKEVVQTNRNDKFICVGQVEPHKGVVFAIEAFMASKTNLKLSIIGAGSQIELIKKLAVNNANIEILGAVRHEEIDKLMGSGRALILPSLCYENSPTSIYEAFGAGLPVIAADIGGVSELINGGCGILFEPGSKDDLMEKIDWLINNPLEVGEMTKRAKEKINNYEINTYLDVLLKN